MRSLIRYVGAVVWAALIATDAGATTVNFEAVPLNTCVSSYSESGVTFMNGGSFYIQYGAPNGTASLLGCEEPFSIFTGRFDVAFSGYISIDLGDFGADSDVLYLQARNSNGEIISEVSRDIASAAGMFTFELFANDIKISTFTALE